MIMTPIWQYKNFDFRSYFSPSVETLRISIFSCCRKTLASCHWLYYNEILIRLPYIWRKWWQNMKYVKLVMNSGHFSLSEAYNFMNKWSDAS
jgi:hypothetical protein